MDYEPLPIISTDFPKVVGPLIDAALFSIDIIVYDWRFYSHDHNYSINNFNSAIARAVVRGVKVRCLVQSVAVVNTLKKLGCDARLIRSKRILHTKLLILDKKGVVIGSHNYTQSAFQSNHEASIYCTLSSEKNALVQYFNNLWGL